MRTKQNIQYQTNDLLKINFFMNFYANYRYSNEDTKCYFWQPKKKQEKVSSEAHCFEKHKLKNKFLYFLKQLVKLKK